LKFEYTLLVPFGGPARYRPLKVLLGGSWVD
jgi:hypothetical protein